MQVFENALWLFTSHPFDVGDVIKHGGTRYTVKSIKLQRLHLARVDGAHVVLPTEQMRSALIHNVTRCAPALSPRALRSSTTSPVCLSFGD